MYYDNEIRYASINYFNYDSMDSLHILANDR